MLLAPNGPAPPVKGAYEVVFTLPKTFAVGMLSPAPSVNALALVKYAKTFMLVLALANAQVVVIATGALPFEVPLAARVKFTVAGLADTVSDSARTAFRATVAVLELSAWAFETWVTITANPKTPRMIRTFFNAFMKPPSFEFERRTLHSQGSNTGATRLGAWARLNLFTRRL